MFANNNQRKHSRNSISRLGSISEDNETEDESEECGLEPEESWGARLPDDGEVLVEIKQLFFGYFAGDVLRGICVAIPRGRIYGLLGATKCGKTTLLKCILGLIKSGRGTVMVAGHRPGDRNCFVPGVEVGYMPQKNSLMEAFTVVETLRYFALLVNFDPSMREARIGEILRLLGMELISRRSISTLSKDEKHRTSIALALLHPSQLLVLDEPMAGLDPPLRSRLWRHLVDECRLRRNTVIITTNEVEEARHCSVIGYMLDGKMKAEAKPQELKDYLQESNLATAFNKLAKLEKYDKLSARRASAHFAMQTQTRLLQINPELFKKLADIEEDGNENDEIEHRITIEEVNNNANGIAVDDEVVKYSLIDYSKTVRHIYFRVMAQIWKEFVIVRHNFFVIFLLLLLAPLQLVVMNYIFRVEPGEVSLGWWSPENIDFSNFWTDPNIDLQKYNSKQEAIDSFNDQSEDAIVLLPNFFNREWFNATRDGKIFVDHAGSLASQRVIQSIDTTVFSLVKNYFNFTQEATTDFIFDAFPFENYTVNKFSPRNFIDYFLIGQLPSLVLSGSLIVAGSVLRYETHNFVVRNQVVGLTTAEVLGPIWSLSFCFSITQISLLLVVFRYLCGILINDLLQTSLLLLPQALCGISVGLAIGAYFSYGSLILASILFNLPLSTISGSLWPNVSKHYSYYTIPTGVTSEKLKKVTFDVVSRADFEIYFCIISPLIWSFVLLFLTYFKLRH